MQLLTESFLVQKQFIPENVWELNLQLSQLILHLGWSGIIGHTPLTFDVITGAMASFNDGFKVFAWRRVF